MQEMEERKRERAWRGERLQLQRKKEKRTKPWQCKGGEESENFQQYYDDFRAFQHLEYVDVV